MINRLTTTVRWRASLSTGDTFTEGVGLVAEIDSELSPWNKLQKYISEHNDVKITSLCLISGKHTFNLPSSGNNPKFRAFDEEKKPLRFNFFRTIGSELGNYGMKVTDHFAVIEARYDKYSLFCWVDELNTNNSWVLIKEHNGLV